MASGVRTFIVCTVRSDGGASVAPCIDTGAGPSYPTLVEGTLVDAGLATQLEAAAAPFDYALAGQFYLFAFSSILSVYMLSVGVGYILRTVRET
jgi:hypothetical protein